MSNYSYKPLDLAKNEIRVLKILTPASTRIATDLVQVSIRHVSLDDLRPEFADPSTPKDRPMYLPVIKGYGVEENDLAHTVHKSYISSWRYYIDKTDSNALVQDLEIDSSLLPDPPSLEGPDHSSMAPQESTYRHSRYQHSDFYWTTNPHWRVGHRFNWGDFEALSYCWESDVREKEVLVDGVVVQVPKNLEAMLKKLPHLPEANSGMHFWIDGLCIDQNNISEKNHQVQLMKRIYTEALGVIVWLGDGNSDSDQAMDMLAQIAEVSIRCKRVKSRKESGGMLGPRALQSIRAWICRVSWGPVLGLLSRNYWKRMWIIQELALNHNMTMFMCGNRQVPRKAIWGTCSFFQDWSREIDQTLLEQCRASTSPSSADCDIFQTAYDVYMLFTLYPDVKSDKFDALLDLARKSKVRDPKDKVYGLLGLLTHPITPDYHKSTAEIYEEFGMTILQNCARLDDLLSWCNFEKESVLPSWIPDWEKPFERYHLRWFRKWQAGGQLIPTWSVPGDGLGLRVIGVMVDFIESVGYAPSRSLPCRTGPQPNLNPSETSRTFGRYENESRLKEAVHRTLLHAHPMANEHGNLMDIYWVSWDAVESSDDYDTQLSDFWTYGMAAIGTSHNARLHPWNEFDQFRQTNAHFSVFGHAFKNLFPDMRQYRVKSFPESSTAPARRELTPHELTEHHFRNMGLANIGLRGRKLITTKTRFLGLAPEQAQEGDVIAVLYGCNFPVVLRPHGDEYKYVGECYIDGIMNGEALEAQKKGESQEAEITLC